MAVGFAEDVDDCLLCELRESGVGNSILLSRCPLYSKLELFWLLRGLSVLPVASWPEIDNFF